MNSLVCCYSAKQSHYKQVRKTGHTERENFQAMIFFFCLPIGKRTDCESLWVFLLLNQSFSEPRQMLPTYRLLGLRDSLFYSCFLWYTWATVIKQICPAPRCLSGAEWVTIYLVLVTGCHYSHTGGANKWTKKTHPIMVEACFANKGSSFSRGLEQNCCFTP